ncbi:MAG: TIGR00266 family protein [Geobacter sp.]
MLCPLCKEEIIDGAIKCKHCGGMLNELPAVTSAVTTSRPCQYCKELIHPEAIKCKFCGAMLNQAVTPGGMPQALGQQQMYQGAPAEYEVLYPGSYAMARVKLKHGQMIKAESDAMVAMSPTIDVQGKLEGGVLGALGRKFLTGESAFFQTLTANRGDGEVLLAPSTPGDVQILELNGSNFFFVQKEGFLAGDASLVIEAASQGIFKGLLSGVGIFIQRISGVGKLVISSFGAIHKLTLGPADMMVVDNAHLVAWSESVSYEVVRASKGLLDTFTSGEGLVCNVRGPGEMYIQTRNKGSFGSWIAQFLPKSSD